MGKHPEKILCVRRGVLEALLGGALPGGFIPPRILSLTALLSRCELCVRDDVEHDPSIKQIIPYTVFTYGPYAESKDEPRVEEQVFTYLRGDGSDESRLHAKRSLGAGGHIEETDFETHALLDEMAPYELVNAYHAAWERELREEIDARCTSHPKAEFCNLAGYVNDDGDEVGSVHFGVVHRRALLEPEVNARECRALVDPVLVSPAALRLAKPEFESWSRIVIDAFWPAPV